MENHKERKEVLAYVAGKCHQENLQQKDIAEMIRVTRSGVSHILSEVR